MKTTFLAALLFAAAGGAHADSDGYWCTSNGYLAYELRSWSPPGGRHVLNVVRVGGPAGIAEPISVGLEEFQLHGIQCLPDRVVLWSWDKTYTVVLPGGGATKAPSSSAHAPGQIPKEHAVKNSLTGARASSRVSLASADSKHSYALEIEHREEKETTPDRGGAIHHYVKSRVAMRDPDGALSKEKAIYEGAYEETVD